MQEQRPVHDVLVQEQEEEEDEEEQEDEEEDEEQEEEEDEEEDEEEEDEEEEDKLLQLEHATLDIHEETRKRLQAQEHVSEREWREALRLHLENDLILAPEVSGEVIRCQKCHEPIEERARVILQCGHCVHVECFLSMFVESDQQCHICDAVKQQAESNEHTTEWQQHGKPVDPQRNPLDLGRDRNVEWLLRLRIQLMESLRIGTWDRQMIADRLHSRNQRQSGQLDVQRISQTHVSGRVQQQERQQQHARDIQERRQGWLARTASQFLHAITDDQYETERRQKHQHLQERLQQDDDAARILRDTTIDARQSYLFFGQTSLASVELIANISQRRTLLHSNHALELVARHADPIELALHGVTCNSFLKYDISMSVLLDHGYTLQELISIGLTFQHLLALGLNLDLLKRYRHDLLPMRVMRHVLQVSFGVLFDTVFRKSLSQFCQVDWSLQELRDDLGMQFSQLRTRQFQRIHLFMMRHWTLEAWCAFQMSAEDWTVLHLTERQFLYHCGYDRKEFRRLYNQDITLVPSVTSDVLQQLARGQPLLGVTQRIRTPTAEPPVEKKLSTFHNVDLMSDWTKEEEVEEEEDAVPEGPAKEKEEEEEPPISSSQQPRTDVSVQAAMQRQQYMAEQQRQRDYQEREHRRLEQERNDQLLARAFSQTLSEYEYSDDDE